MGTMKRTTLGAVAALLSLAWTGTGRADTLEYYHLDPLGSVRAVTDEAGTVIERHDYYPYGEECTTGVCANNPGVGAASPRSSPGRSGTRRPASITSARGTTGQRVGRFITVDPESQWRRR